MRGIDRCSSTDDDLPIKKMGALSFGAIRQAAWRRMCVCVIDTYIFASVRARARVLD